MALERKSDLQTGAGAGIGLGRPLDGNRSGPQARPGPILLLAVAPLGDSPVGGATARHGYSQPAPTQLKAFGVWKSLFPAARRRGSRHSPNAWVLHSGVSLFRRRRPPTPAGNPEGAPKKAFMGALPSLPPCPRPPARTKKRCSPVSGDRTHGALGVRFDSATGLHYMRARWYDSGLGWFISRDPLYSGGQNTDVSRDAQRFVSLSELGQVSGSQFLSERRDSGFEYGNLYRYCRNSPATIIDPTGLIGQMKPDFSKPPGGKKKPPHDGLIPWYQSPNFDPEKDSCPSDCLLKYRAKLKLATTHKQRQDLHDELINCVDNSETRWIRIDMVWPVPGPDNQLPPIIWVLPGHDPNVNP